MTPTSVEFSSLFQAVLVSLILTLGTCVAGIWIARRYKLLDVPGVAAYKLHKLPMPYAGGIALAMSLLILTVSTGLWRDP